MKNSRSPLSRNAGWFSWRALGVPGQRWLKKSELGASRAQQPRAAPDQPAEPGAGVFCFLTHNSRNPAASTAD